MSIPHSRTTIEPLHIKAVNDCLNSGVITSARLNEEFCEIFADFTGSKYCDSFSSGSQALYFILRSINLDKNDEVLIPDYICKDVLLAVNSCGAKAVLYDNLAESWLSGLEKIEPLINSGTKAVVINYTFGYAHSTAAELKKKFPNLIVIEDCCHAIPVKRKVSGVKVLDGDVAFYSFNATKLIASGEGGAITTDNEALYRKIKTYKVGSGLSDMEVSLLRSQLSGLETYYKKRKQIAERYLDELPEISVKNTSKSPGIFFRFPVEVNDPAKFLESKAVSFRRGVDDLLHFSRGLPDSAYINATERYNKTISVPVYPSLTDEEQSVIIHEFNRICELENC